MAKAVRQAFNSVPFFRLENSPTKRGGLYGFMIHAWRSISEGARIFMREISDETAGMCGM
jgi:hypothetical protein